MRVTESFHEEIRIVAREPEKKNPSFVSRHFWVVLCGLFIALYVPLMAREWLSLRSEGLRDIVYHTTALTKLLERDLEQSISLAEILSDFDDPGNIKDLDDHIRQKIGFLGLQKVNIYGQDGRILYPRTPGITDKIPGDNFRAALGGKIVSKIIERDDYQREYGQDIPVDLAEVYHPIRDGEGKVLFVMEV